MDNKVLFTKQMTDDLVAINATSWNEDSSVNFYQRVRSTHTFTPEEIVQILNSDDVLEKQRLSYEYFLRDGLYKKIIYYYATVLTYSGLLIPHSNKNGQLSKNSKTLKQYNSALSFLSKAHIPELCTRISLTVLINGVYYGIIKEVSKDNLVIFDLPVSYCRSLFKDYQGNDIVDFNVRYFNTITDEDSRNAALKSYPSVISRHYRAWASGKTGDPWIRLPATMAFSFSFFDDGWPFLIDIIPNIEEYDKAIDTERERELEEIRKIIVQHVPHLNDGTLLFEPEEALEMHRGAVGMLKGNKNLSVLTTYTDVEAIISRTAADNASNSLEKMLQTVYSAAGVSPQIFSASGTQAIGISIQNDITLMMILARKYSRFLTYIINNLFGNGNIYFTYDIMPISEYNRSDFIKDSLKLAQSGYSFLIPALASGIDQRDLLSVKTLENDLLDLTSVLIPLSSSYTQSGTGEPGAPEKALEDKSPKTIQNEDAIDHQGGSNE